MTIQRAILKGTLGETVEIRNMFTCSVTEVGSDDSQTLWGAYMSSLLDAIPPLVVVAVHYYSYEVQFYSTPNWITLDEVALDEDGTQTGDVLPFQSALVLIGKAGGLHAIGRKFFSGIAESQQQAGSMVVGVAEALAALLAAYITPFAGLSGGTIVPGVLDKTGTFRPFVAGYVSSLLGTMRRRKPGVGI